MENYCWKCGTKLELKFLNDEGMVPFCKGCNDYRFPFMNVACSMIILNPDETKMLYIKQYGTGFNRLVAGYTNKGENLEHTVYREMGEEIGRYPTKVEFNASKYFPKSNSLIANFITKLTTEEINANSEVDSYEWVELKDAKEKIKDAKLAAYFVDLFFEKYGK